MSLADYISTLFEYAHQYEQTFFIGLLIISRLLPIFYLTPFLAGTSVPAATRLGLAICITFIVYPGVDISIDREIGIAESSMLFFKELCLGFTHRIYSKSDILPGPNGRK